MTPLSNQDQSGLGFAKFLSWTSLVLILVTSLTLSVFIANSARSALLKKQQEFSQLLAENLNHQVYRRFTLPTLIGYGRVALRKPEQYERLDQVIQSTIGALHIERLRIYAPDGVISYASNKEDLGKTDLGGLAVQKAFKQKQHSFEIESTISPWLALLKYNMKPGTFMLRTTSPLLYEGEPDTALQDKPVTGILEITQDITSDMKTVIQFQWVVILTSIVSSVFLFLILFFMIKRSERALQDRVREKERLERELHQHEKLAGMGRVVSSIAHEIRNPLGIISSSAELLLNRPNTDDLTKNILQAIYDEAKRLSKTVHDFLDYARPKAPAKEPVDAGRVIDQALGFLEQELAQHEVQINRAYAEGLSIGGDQDLLYRAFYNIVANGLQALDGPGTISIIGCKQDGHISLTFRDSGPGFDLEQIDKMLDPFFTTKDDGTGLGLAIVNSIITSHDGVLTLGNSPEGGAEVHLQFPALN